MAKPTPAGVPSTSSTTAPDAVRLPLSELLQRVPALKPYKSRVKSAVMQGRLNAERFGTGKPSLYIIDQQFCDYAWKNWGVALKPGDIEGAAERGLRHTLPKPARLPPAPDPLHHARDPALQDSAARDVRQVLQDLDFSIEAGDVTVSIQITFSKP